eukprot:COSAG05_NODE_18937_length_300_cov_1.024876_1_plen_35_part_10
MFSALCCSLLVASFATPGQAQSEDGLLSLEDGSGS